MSCTRVVTPTTAQCNLCNKVFLKTQFNGHDCGDLNVDIDVQPARWNLKVAKDIYFGGSVDCGWRPETKIDGLTVLGYMVEEL